jgi:hypothetical protein
VAARATGIAQDPILTAFQEAESMKVKTQIKAGMIVAPHPE